MISKIYPGNTYVGLSPSEVYNILDNNGHVLSTSVDGIRVHFKYKNNYYVRYTQTLERTYDYMEHLDDYDDIGYASIMDAEYTSNKFNKATNNAIAYPNCVFKEPMTQKLQKDFHDY